MDFTVKQLQNLFILIGVVAVVAAVAVFCDKFIGGVVWADTFISLKYKAALVGTGAAGTLLFQLIRIKKEKKP